MKPEASDASRSPLMASCKRLCAALTSSGNLRSRTPSGKVPGKMGSFGDKRMGE